MQKTIFLFNLFYFVLGSNVKWSIFGYSFFLLLIPTKLYMKHPKKMPFNDQKIESNNSSLIC